MGVSPPLLVRCHNHSGSVVRAGPPVAPPGLRGDACDAFAEASIGHLGLCPFPPPPPPPPPPLLFSMCNATFPPSSFLLPSGGSRTIPLGIGLSRRLLFLFRSFVSFLPSVLPHTAIHYLGLEYPHLSGMSLPPSTLLFLLRRCFSLSDVSGAVICDLHLLSSELGCTICFIFLDDLVLEGCLKSMISVIYCASSMCFCFGFQLFKSCTDPAIRSKYLRHFLSLCRAHSQEVHAAL